MLMALGMSDSHMHLYFQHPEEFVEVLLASIIERSNRLLLHVAVIHKALLEIVNLTASSHTDGRSTKTTASLTSTTPAKSKLSQTAASSSSGEKGMGSLSNKSTPQREPSSRLLSSGSYKPTSTNSVVCATTPTHGLAELTLHQFGPDGEEVLNYFCQLVSQAVVRAVMNSHSKFLSTVHPTAVAETIAQDSRDTKPSLIEKSVKFSPPNDMDFDKEGGDEMSYSTNAKANRLLRLTVDVNFATPRIQLEPTLDCVHSDLLEVSDTLLRVLHRVKWWARPNVGRTLYDVYDIRAKDDAMRSTILKSIHGNLHSNQSCIICCSQFAYMPYTPFCLSGPW